MTEKRPDKPENPDVEISAVVKARELYFDEVPEMQVRFPGYPERESVSGTERENLPDEVEPGVTYRDPKVRLRIASALVEEDPELRGLSGKGQRRGSSGNRTRRKK